MKYYAILISILISNLLFGQVPIINEIPKKGIYSSFEEFKYNSPSLVFDFKFERNDKNEMLVIPTDTIIDDFKIISSWGISDGYNIYINRRNYSDHGGFTQLDGLGLLCYFSDTINMYNESLKLNLQDNYGKVREAIVININSGKIFVLSNAMVHDLQKGLEENHKLTRNGDRVDDILTFIENYNRLKIDEVIPMDSIDIVIYRRAKKEKDEAVTVKVNGINRGELNTEDAITLKLNNPLNAQFCINDKCWDFDLKSTTTNFIECSYSSKTGEIELTQVSQKEGKFYSNRIIAKEN
ncbi:MAG: hypothetical protein ABJH05_18935 [Fulvivirga sp.]